MCKKKIIIPEDCKKFLDENLSEYKECEEINDLLDILDDLITYKGFDQDYEPNDFGIKAERVYDKIFYAN